MLNLCESIAFDSRRRRIVSSRTRETFGRNCFLRGLQREPRCKENESRSLICGTRFKFKALLFFSMQESLANQSRRLKWKEFSKNFYLSSPPSVPSDHSKFMRESLVRQRIKASYLVGDELLWLTRKLIWNFVLLAGRRIRTSYLLRRLLPSAFSLHNRSRIEAIIILENFSIFYNTTIYIAAVSFILTMQERWIKDWMEILFYLLSKGR